MPVDVVQYRGLTDSVEGEFQSRGAGREKACFLVLTSCTIVGGT